MRQHETRKAAGSESGGWKEMAWLGSAFDRVGTRSVLGLRGYDRQAHLLADRPGEETRAPNALATQSSPSTLSRTLRRAV